MCARHLLYPLNSDGRIILEVRETTPRSSCCIKSTFCAGPTAVPSAAFPTAAYRQSEHDSRWCWTGAAAWGRVELLGSLQRGGRGAGGCRRLRGGRNNFPIRVHHLATIRQRNAL